VIAFGIDPGSLRTGWGAVRVEGNRLVSLGFDVIQTSGELPLADRVGEIFAALRLALDAHRPDTIYVESIFHHKSAKSALVLGHARGVALLAARLNGAPVGEVSPAEVKKSVTGSGRAEKSQVQEMVRVLLGLGQNAPRDAADALAIAIAGATRARSPISRLLGAPR